MLHEDGVRQQTLVANTLPNSPERVLCEVGIVMAGAVSVNAQCQLADGEHRLCPAWKLNCAVKLSPFFLFFLFVCCCCFVVVCLFVCLFFFFGGGGGGGSVTRSNMHLYTRENVCPYCDHMVCIAYAQPSVCVFISSSTDIKTHTKTGILEYITFQAGMLLLKFQNPCWRSTSWTGLL